MLKDKFFQYNQKNSNCCVMWIFRYRRDSIYWSLFSGSSKENMKESQRSIAWRHYADNLTLMGYIETTDGNRFVWVDGRFWLKWMEQNEEFLRATKNLKWKKVISPKSGVNNVYKRRRNLADFFIFLLCISSTQYLRVALERWVHIMKHSLCGCVCKIAVDPKLLRLWWPRKKNLLRIDSTR